MWLCFNPHVELPLHVLVDTFHAFCKNPFQLTETTPDRFTKNILFKKIK